MARRSNTAKTVTETAAVETAPVETNTTVTETLPTQPTESDAELVTKLMARFSGNKSAVIRQLAADGYKRGPIAKMMGIRYQFVRQVLVTELAKKSAD